MADTTVSRTTAFFAGDFTRRISWSAIIAGVVIAVAMQLLLNLLGMAIGLWTVDVDALGAFGIGAGIWWLLSSLISVFTGAWVASHLSGVIRKGDGMIHGLLVWSLGSLLMVWFLTTTAGALIGGAASMVGRAAAGAGSVLESAAPEVTETVSDFAAAQGMPGAEVMREMRDAFTGPEADQTREELQQLFSQARQQDMQSPEFRQQVVSFLVDRGGMEQQRAQQLTDRAISEIQQARQQLAQTGQEVKQSSEEIAHSTGQAAFWAFLALLAGAIAAAFGGRSGTPHDLVAEDDFSGAHASGPAR